MRDLRRLLDELPRALRDGTWTHCEVSLSGRRLILHEPRRQARARYRRALRRRAVMAGLGLLALATVPWLADRAQAAGAILASLLLLGAVDGLRRDRSAGDRPFRLAILDALEQRVDLLRPDGTGLSIPLGDIDMFLLVHEAAARRFHLGVVVHGRHFLPWLHTHSPTAAGSMAWLLGYLSDRPARRVEAALPPELEAIATAQPVTLPDEIG